MQSNKINVSLSSYKINGQDNKYDLQININTSNNKIRNEKSNLIKNYQ